MMKDNHRVQMSSTISSDDAGTESIVDEKQKAKSDDDDNKINDEGSLEMLQKKLNNSWMAQLETESLENRKKSLRRVNLDLESHTENDMKRPVFNGHYIKVQPKPLEEPRLVIHSPQVADDLGLSEHDVQSDAFVQYVSADLDGFNQNNHNNGKKAEAWATPYALSIMGTRYTSNCPFGTGDGYGDGRAMSIGEFLIDDEEKEGASRLELQLKGAGPTPFCRGADGRAVFRSSIREFLASEAMHHLGISTTRALSLVVSPINTSRRPWYSPQNTKQIPDIMNDPRFVNKYSKEQLKHILAQINAQTKNDPDMLVEEPNAITCRVSPSFVRVGHLDLFARRATAEIDQKRRKTSNDKTEAVDDPLVWKELKQLLWHACFREFYDTCYAPYYEKDDIVSASKCLLRQSMEGISTMVAEWIRVGFAQGNFNADNCLIAGRTMDYGPFGFMDEYHPLFAKWTGSGDHFGFMNQANAGYVNFGVLLESVMPIIERYSEDEKEADTFRESILLEAQKVFTHKVDAVFRKKLGFDPNDESGDTVWNMLEPMLRSSKTDWTVFWRRLTAVAKEYPISDNGKDSDVNYEELLQMLHGNDEVKEGSSPFYEPLPDDVRKNYLKWIKVWRDALEAAAYKQKLQSTNESLEIDESAKISVYERMRLANPKYTLREWMLVDAYTKADSSSMSNAIFDISNQSTDESEIHNLFQLIQNPYDEGTDEQDLQYYRRAPDKALKQGGIAFMS
jgi:uncharacterized protein YdiU (UPF0061 family)